MKLLPALRRSTDLEPQRDNQIDYTLDSWMAYLNELVYSGNTYFTQSPYQTMPGQQAEPIGPAYRSITDLAYKSDSIVFSCMQVRARHFRQARFQFRRINNGRPGDLFGTAELAPLETPWVGGTTADLLTRMIMHADLGGNAFVVRRGDGLALLRPDWVTIVIGSNTDPHMGAWATDAEIIGYVYSPGGYSADADDREIFEPEEVAHFAPIPDPEARFRGMSWLTPLLREVMADKAATETKLRFWENPTPNMVVKFEVPTLEEFKKQVAAFKEAHAGPRNAFKWMFTASGVDATPVGSNLHDLDFRLITGAGETRIAAAAGTPPVLVGLSEGLQGSSLNAGNYQAARRNFADGVIRDLWSDAAGSLANIINVPGGSELWYDGRDVAFLKEDLQERAGVQQTKAQAIRYLVDAGYKPDTVVAAIEAEDFSMLEHSGLFSVQLQAANAPKQGLFQGVPIPNEQPGQIEQPPANPAATNGNSNGNGRGRGFLDDYPIYRYEPQPAETHIHFDEGAITIPPAPSADVHIHEGAIRSEVHLDSPVTRIEDGAIRVDAPPPAEVSVSMDLEPVGDGLRALAEREATQVTVEAAPVPVVNVTNEVPAAEVVVNVPEDQEQPLNINPGP